MLKKPDDDSQMKNIPSYYEIKKKKREDTEVKESEFLQSIFENAIEFYNKNYPKSNRDPPFKYTSQKRNFQLKKKGIFTEELKKRSMEDLLLAREILLYCIQERGYTSIPEKNLTTMDIKRKLLELRGRIKNIIPGGKILDKIEKLETQKRQKEEALINLKKKYADIIANVKKNEIPKIVKVEEEKEEKFICDKCNREFKSAGGLGSHAKTCKGIPESL